MTSSKNEMLLSYITKYYSDYYRFLTTEQAIVFSEENLTGDENRIIALKFILGHLMLRGRSDNLSSTYTKSYLEILDLDGGETRGKIENLIIELKETLRLIQNGHSITIKQLSERFDAKTTSATSYHVNPKDLKMIVDLLKYQIDLFGQGRNNMFDYFASLIQQNNIIQAYSDLLKISNVGDKLASFTLRDIVFLSSKCLYVKFRACDYLMLFPIDRWVKKGGKQLLGINPGERINHFALKFELIRLCEELTTIEQDSLIPLKLNAGIWYQFFRRQKAVIQF